MPLNASTVHSILSARLDRVALAARSKAHGSIVRERVLCAADLLSSLLLACGAGPVRSIAQARRAWEGLTHDSIDAKSFDARVASPGTVAWLWGELLGTFVSQARRLRRLWPLAMQRVVDIVVEDGSILRLRKGLAGTLPMTTAGLAGLKIMGTLSMDQGSLVALRTGGAKHHDEKLRRTPTLPEGCLSVHDLGFYSHVRFAEVQDAKQWFLSRLKTGVMPRIVFVAEGVAGGDAVLGKRLDDDLTYTGVVDVDARFNVPKEPKGRVWRAVLTSPPDTETRPHKKGKMMSCWFVTNLPREEWSVDALGTAYRLRWWIERLWRRCKNLARLDHLQTTRMTVVYVFLAASLLLVALANALYCAQAELRGWARTSEDATLLVLQAWLPALLAHYRGRRVWQPAWLDAFVKVLDHEATHHRRTQPLRAQTIHDAFSEPAAAPLAMAA